MRRNNMYKIEKTEYGIKNTFSGNIDATEMNEWKKESEVLLEDMPKEFVVYIDMIGLKILSDDAKHIISEGQKIYRQKGMKRSVVVLKSATVALQFKNIARETGIYDYERYLSSEKDDYEDKAMLWLLEGKE